MADIYYAQADYARAAQLSQKATAQMSDPDLKDRAKAAWVDFTATLPDVNSIAAIKKWMHPSADLADFEPPYDGLRLAGIGN